MTIENRNCQILGTIRLLLYEVDQLYLDWCIGAIVHPRSNSHFV